jgi:hypothetical protein
MSNDVIPISKLTATKLDDVLSAMEINDLVDAEVI